MPVLPVITDQPVVRDRTPACRVAAAVRTGTPARGPFDCGRRITVHGKDGRILKVRIVGHDRWLVVHQRHLQRLRVAEGDPVRVAGGWTRPPAWQSRWERRSASWYGGPDDGLTGYAVACSDSPTGGVLTSWALTFASRDGACGQYARVCFGRRCVWAYRDDWGPAGWTGRSIDLGPAVAHALGFSASDVGQVRFRWVRHGQQPAE